MKPKRKKLLIGGIAAVAAAAIGAGIWFGTRGSGEPVKVFPFRYIGMTEYWGDTQESYGPVSTDRIQTIYLSETQTVTEIAVSVGDTVAKGDLLMTFDTTLTDIALERKRLDVEKLKLQLENAQADLLEIKAMKPMVIPTYTSSSDDSDADTGDYLTGTYALSQDSDYDGSSRESALICWLNTAASIDDTVLEVLRLQAEEYQNKNAQREASSASAVPETPTETEPSETQPETTSPEEPEYTEGTDPVETEPEVTEKPYEPFEVYEYYAIIKVTENNAELGSRLTWQGLHVWGSAAKGFRFQMFDAYGVPDHMLSDEEDADTSIPEIDYGSGYTSAQIAQMRSDQEEKIKQLEFDIKMAETNYQIMLTEVSDGNVYAQIDGEVVSVLSEEEARLQKQPIVKVSGGGGFFIEGSISELDKENLTPGQEVTINDWNTGMTYTGSITAIGDFPTGEDGWNGIGNPNASYYPFTAFVDETADLQAGSYASIQFSAGGSEHGIYLENPFIRTEQGNSYVYVRGENGRLEKRQVTVGKALWGNYKEILSGLTEEDYIAFPYGKDLKVGAETVESDLSALYDY